MIPTTPEPSGVLSAARLLIASRNTEDPDGVGGSATPTALLSLAVGAAAVFLAATGTMVLRCRYPAARDPCSSATVAAGGGMARPCPRSTNRTSSGLLGASSSSSSSSSMLPSPTGACAELAPRLVTACHVSLPRGTTPGHARSRSASATASARTVKPIVMPPRVTQSGASASPSSYQLSPCQVAAGACSTPLTSRSVFGLAGSSGSASPVTTLNSRSPSGSQLGTPCNSLCGSMYSISPAAPPSGTAFARLPPRGLQGVQAMPPQRRNANGAAGAGGELHQQPRFSPFMVLSNAPSVGALGQSPKDLEHYNRQRCVMARAE